MYLIDHNQTFTTGCRVLMLKGRHKDGIEHERQIIRVTTSTDAFMEVLSEFTTLARPGERIYASASERDVAKAARLFKQRQIDADYDDDPMRFYRHLNERWASALMAPTSQADKLWLFDCDSATSAVAAQDEVPPLCDGGMQPYRYESKSGVHILVRPFDRSKLSPSVRAMIHENPIMLWGY